MLKVYERIPKGLLFGARDAITLSNHHATYFDPYIEHYGTAAVIEAARAAELLIKAIVASHHPLLIFKDIFNLNLLDDPDLDLDSLTSKAKTHDISKLPNVLWLVTAEKIQDQELFDDLVEQRNALQHFFHHETFDVFAEKSRTLALRFIYTNLDPLLRKHFNEYAINCYEHQSDGYEYTVKQLLNRGIHFSIPDDFGLGEIDASEEILHQSVEYKAWFSEEMARINRRDVFEFKS